jgi:hypothetical protein
MLITGLSISGQEMSARQQVPYDSMARKWLALAQRRRAHLIELRENGRWQRYYAEGQIADQLRELDTACQRFAAVAGAGTPEASDVGGVACDGGEDAQDAAA